MLTYSTGVQYSSKIWSEKFFFAILDELGHIKNMYIEKVHNEEYIENSHKINDNNQ